MPMKYLWIIFASLLILAIPTLLQAQEELQKAGLLVQYEDGREERFCISYQAEEKMTVEELLRRSERPIVVQAVGSMGAAVCQIDGQGCAFPAEPCFCQCMGPDCRYWGLQQLVDGEWRYLNRGATSSEVKPGEVYGFAWGNNSPSAVSSLPVGDFADFCPIEAAPPTAEPATQIASLAPTSPATNAEAPSASAPPAAAEPAPSTESSSWSSYIGFAVILVILAALAIFATRKRA